MLVANHIEALLAIGEWDEADRRSAAALRAITANFPYMLLMLRADLEIGRGDSTARGHISTPRAPRCARTADSGSTTSYLAELALWERRWTDAEQAVSGRPGAWHVAASRPAPRLVLRQGAARTGGAGGARPRPPRHRRARVAGSVAREAASPSLAAPPPRPRRSRRTPPAGWPWPRPSTSAPAVSRRPELWSEAAAAWDRLERPPLAAYCRWREAEALVAAGASRTEASAPLGEAYAVATRIGAKPLLREIELLAQRARLDLAPPDAGPPDGTQASRRPSA